MDLAVRASLKGWKFLFVGDLAVSVKACNCLSYETKYTYFYSQLLVSGEK